MKRKRKLPGLILAVAGSMALVVALWWAWQSRPGYHIEPGIKAVEDAFHNRQTGIMAEVTGTVVRILTDDKSDPYTQKFVISLRNGQRVLVAHDIRAGEQVPLTIDSKITVRGEYSWTETGGTMKHTVRDPTSKRRHGWIVFDGQRYD